MNKLIMIYLFINSAFGFQQKNMKRKILMAPLQGMHLYCHFRDKIRFKLNPFWSQIVQMLVLVIKKLINLNNPLKTIKTTLKKKVNICSKFKSHLFTDLNLTIHFSDTRGMLAVFDKKCIIIVCISFNFEI